MERVARNPRQSPDCGARSRASIRATRSLRRSHRGGGRCRVSVFFWLRSAESSVLDQPLDYIPYVFLARSITDCDREIRNARGSDAAVNENSYLTCIRDAMKRKLAQQ